MNAVAILTNAEVTNTNSWLAPTSALRQQTDGHTVVMVLRGEKYPTIPVVTGETQGIWTLVQSAALRKGHKVIGGVASYVGQEAVPGAMNQ